MKSKVCIDCNININEQYKCFNWKNCRPLEKSLNINKSNKILPKQILLQELKVHYFINMQHILQRKSP